MTRKTLPVALIQETNHGDADANLAVIEDRVAEAAASGAKLVLLQELHNGKYFCQHESVDEFDLAEKIPGPSTERLGQLAKRHGVVPVSYTHLDVYKRQRDALQTVVEEQANDDAKHAKQPRLHQIGEVRHAGEAPQTAVQTHPPEHHRLQSQHDGKLGPVERRHDAIGDDAVTEPMQHAPYDGNHEQVMGNDEQAWQRRTPACSQIQPHPLLRSTMSMAAGLRTDLHIITKAVYLALIHI